MAIPSTAETMRNNRAESLARRTPYGMGSDDGPSRKLEGLRNLKTACEIDIDRIIPDADQPRKEFDEAAIARLAVSLKTRGQLQPIRVRWSAEAEHYVVIVGERRWRAARIAGMQSVACIVVQGELSAEDLLEDQLIENALREGLKPVEQARSYQALMEARGLTHRDLAERLQIDHTSITRALGLLNLPESVQASIDNGELPASSAYAIASKVDDPAEQADIAARVVAENLSRAETIEVVREVAARSPKSKPSKGRGGNLTRAKLPTSRTIKTGDGFKVTIERKRGFDLLSLLAAMEEATARIRAELSPGPPID